MDELITTNNQITTTDLNSNILERFIKFAEVSERSKDTYLKAVKQFFVYTNTNGIERPTREDVINFRDSLKETHKPTTVQNYMTALKIFFRWCAQENIYSNISDHVKGAKLNRDHKKDFLTASQVRIVLGNIDTSTPVGKRNYALFLLMTVCALRDIEVSRANIEDLTIKGNKTVLYLLGKGREERSDFAIIEPEVEKAIREYLKTRTNKDGKDPLFTSTSNRNANGRMTTRSISGIVKATLRASGYDSERLTSHSLRYTGINLAIYGGKSIEETQQYARHKNIATTMVYFHEKDMAQNTCGATVMNAIFS